MKPDIEGATITSVTVYDAVAVAPATPSSFKRQTRGRRVESLKRRGKYLIFGLDSGQSLVVHLRMTGTLSFMSKPPEGPQKQHLRLLFAFRGGNFLAFNDMRRFGRAFILPATEATGYWTKLGPEPLERTFTADKLRRLLAGSRRPVKSFLLDQSKIAGIGNIYADEALFLAKIRPTRPANSISGSEATQLRKSIRSVLRSAISLKGSSVATYRDTRGSAGAFQKTFKVHTREAEPCPVCNTPVEKIKVGGRGTYFCPACQK